MKSVDVDPGGALRAALGKDSGGSRPSQHPCAFPRLGSMTSIGERWK